MAVGADVKANNSVYPEVGNPFFIVTPPYTRVSAGITALHLLCHYLNANGENAFIVHYPPERDESRFLPPYVGLQRSPEYPGGLMAPLITQQVIDYYDEKKITPILIYPEVFDNPFNANFFVRYILNYPGLLAPKYEQEASYMFAYAKRLQDASKANDLLYIPTCDLNFFNRSGAWQQREGTCYYAGKLKAFLGGEPENVPAGSVEILKSTQMSREEVRDIFWRSEAFYCYEDTALATEAMLCGCPTIFVKNQHFSGEQLAGYELSENGSCIFGEVGGLERAKNSLDQYEAVVREAISAVPLKIKSLAQTLKKRAKDLPYQGTITYPFEPRIAFFDKLALSEVGFKPNEVIPAVAAPVMEDKGMAEANKVAAELLKVISDRFDQLGLNRDESLDRARAEESKKILELVQEYREQLQNVEHALSEVHKSTSWRLTSPMRAIVSVFKSQKR